MNNRIEQWLGGELGTKFGFRRVDCAMPAEAAEQAAAKKAVAQIAGKSPDYDPDALLRNDDLIWIPGFHIGSSGYLVEARTNRVRKLGSGFGDIVVWVWAYYKGLAVDVPVDLIMEVVGDPERVQKLIESFSTPRIAREAIVNFARGVRVLRHVTPGFRWWDLKQAEEQGWFKFSVGHVARGPDESSQPQVSKCGKWV